jgi:ABC-type transport system involved in multi-copper enzyme maturation permease subunit
MIRALKAEILKLKRSRVPWWTGLIVLLTSGMGLAIFPVLSDPKTQAQFTEGGGSFAQAVALGMYDPTWASYLRFGLQGMAGSWGIMTFGFATAYLFARESRERTATTALTLPIRREYLFLAKMVVLAAWVFGLGALSVLLVAGICVVLGTGGFAWTNVIRDVGDMAAVVSLFYATLPLVAWVAMSGKGYLRPMLLSLALWLSCNSLMVTPVSRWVPWTMPIHLVGAAYLPVPPSSLVPSSWVAAAAVFLAGVAACMWRMDHADAVG